jgi:Fe-S cluster assembly iron-binding protein IscA
MFQITDTAATHLRNVLADFDTRDDVCLRLAETQRGLGMVLDQRRPGDRTVRHADELLLVFDATTAERLDGQTMDFNESTEQLVFS